MIVIYGGRNDGIFAGTQNVALNDVNLFNVATRQWTALAMYGLQPCSRWAHVIVPNRTEHPDGFLVFGGVSLNSYCKADFHKFSILNWGQSTWKSEAPPLNTYLDNSPLKNPNEKAAFNISV